MNQFIRFPIQILTSGIIEFMEKSHLRVYICLDSHKDRKCQSFPSLATIRTEIKMCIPVIQAAIKDLIEWGLIKKAHIKREKGRGYRIIYTIIKEPLIKAPHKRIKEKIFSSAKRKRDLKGKFTEQKQPSQRTVLNSLKQPSELDVIHLKKSKQPSDMAITTYPSDMANPKSIDLAKKQSSLTSIEPVKKNPHQNISHKGKTKEKPKAKIDTSEKAWAKGIDILIGEKKKSKLPESKIKEPLKETTGAILKAR